MTDAFQNKGRPVPGPTGALNRWTRFLAGLIMLSVFAGFFMSGYAPPGVFGEVLRHNQGCNIDASPLLYSEVEHMAQLEDGVRQMRETARRQRLLNRR